MVLDGSYTGYTYFLCPSVRGEEVPTRKTSVVFEREDIVGPVFELLDDDVQLRPDGTQEAASCEVHGQTV